MSTHSLLLFGGPPHFDFDRLCLHLLLLLAQFQSALQAFSVQSNIPPHWPENANPQIPPFPILLHWPCVCILLYILFFWLCNILFYNSGMFEVELSCWLSIAGSQMRLRHARHFTWFHWQLQTPPTRQGSRHESGSEARDASRIVSSFCCCSWVQHSLLSMSAGDRRKGTFKQKKSPEADICVVNVQLKKILERRHFNFIELTPSLTFLAWCSSNSVII